MKATTAVAFAVMAGALVTTTGVFADGEQGADGRSRTIAYSGTIERIEGGVPSNVDLGFSAYLQRTGDAGPIWSEQHVGVPTSVGRFSVELGSVNPLDGRLLDAGTFFLEVTVDGVLLQGRQRIGSAPFALRAENGLPVGAIIPFGGQSEPPGWMLCDGRELLRDGYPELFAAVQTAFGGGDGATTFSIPDLRGQFLRGVDGGAGRDPDVESRTENGLGQRNGPGSTQADAFQGHRHRWSWHNSAGDSNRRRGIGENRSNSRQAVQEPTTLAPYGEPRISSETRPRNTYVNFLIKY